MQLTRPKSDLWLITLLTILCLFVLVIAARVDHMGWVRPSAPFQWQPQNVLQRAAMPDFHDDLPVEPLRQALARSSNFFQDNTDRKFIFGPDTFYGAELCDALKRLDSALAEHGLTADLSAYLENEFVFYESSAPRVLFTGYFEAELRGSRERNAEFNYPLYTLPKDLVSINVRDFTQLAAISDLPEALIGRVTDDQKVTAYYSRREIDHEQKLAGKNLELLWTDDEIDAFFLHIQGSGIVTLPDGSKQRLSYSGKNGHPYRAIGKLLLEQHKLSKDELSMQSIKKYLRAHPEELQEILEYNPSYIFFREVKEGPIGSIGVALTPYRSIATDYRLFPQAALAVILTELPEFNAEGRVTGWKSITRLVFNQDTGGAITGPGRVDFFTGSGAESENIAGHLRAEGRIFFLAPAHK